VQECYAHGLVIDADMLEKLIFVYLTIASALYMNTIVRQRQQLIYTHLV
jgi:hypothetical protein